MTLTHKNVPIGDLSFLTQEEAEKTLKELFPSSNILVEVFDSGTAMIKIDQNEYYTTIPTKLEL